MQHIVLQWIVNTIVATDGSAPTRRHAVCDHNDVFEFPCYMNVKLENDISCNKSDCMQYKSVSLGVFFFLY